jgi:D-sedoheptulose 7-phosphate isomerase
MVERYLAETEQAIRLIDRDAVRAVVDALLACWRRDATAYLIGNGGSAATASHMMADLSRCTIVPGAPRFRAIALTDNIPTMTAIANDTSFDLIFAEQLRGLLRSSDVVVAISGSGNSANVLRAIEYAASIGATTIGLCGEHGGELVRRADVAVCIPAARIGQQEDGHLILNHTIALALREKIAAAVPVIVAGG